MNIKKKALCIRTAKVLTGFPSGSSIKEKSPANAGATGERKLDPWVGKIPWKEMNQQAHPRILTKIIPWTEEHAAGYSSWGCKDS